jgi:hypothetical protein
MLAMDFDLASSGFSVQISGYDVAKAATHCTEGKKIRPHDVLEHPSVNVAWC